MAFSIPNSISPSYNCKKSTTDNCRHGPPRPEEYIFASIFPPYAYLNLQKGTTSSNLPPSIRSTPDCAVLSTGIDSGPITSDRNIHRGFGMSEGSHYMLPSDNQSILSGPFDCGFDGYDLTPCFAALDNSSSTFDVQGYFAPNQTMRTEPESSHDINSTGILNDHIQIFSSESCFFRHAGPWNKPSNNDVQQQIEAGFGIPNLQPALHKPTLSLAMEMQPCSEDVAWPVLSPSSYGLDELFQSRGDSDLRLHDMVDFACQTHQNNQSLGDRSVGSNSSLLFKEGFASPNSDLEALSTRKKARTMPKYRNIVPKHKAPSAEVIEGIGGNNVARRGFRKGGRREPLTPDKRQKATKMRDVRACASCYISHIACSTHFVCDKCRKRDERDALQSPGCLRGPLQVYVGLFSPPLLSGHTTKWFVDTWIKQNKVVFTSNHIFVQMSSDPFGISMSLIVHEIFLVNQECLLVADLGGQPEAESQSFPSRITLPYGYKNDIEQLKQRCLEYVDTVSKYPLSAADTIIGDTSGIIWEVLRAVCFFNQANPLAKMDGLLRKGINVFWMDYMMNRSFTFNDDSAVKAIQSLQTPSLILPHQPFISAALLSRQIKVAISLLLEDYIGDLFEGLERKSRNNRASWAICFCINLILCILVEQVQIAIDAIVIDKIYSGQDAGDTRKTAIGVCEALEELPLKYSWILFDGIQRKYNPIKDGCLVDNSSGQNQGEADLVNSIRRVIHSRDDEISEKVAYSCLSGLSETPEDHDRFRTCNSGRHVAKFLRNFC